MKSTRKRLVADCDKLFSKYIRERDKRAFGACPFVCGGPIERAFHFVTRSKHSVRWNELNAVGSCSGCNYRYEFDPHFAILWYINRFGEPAYESLVASGNRQAKYSMDDLRAIKARIQASLNAVSVADQVFGRKA